jgi:hypothetical protein
MDPAPRRADETKQIDNQEVDRSMSRLRYRLATLAVAGATLGAIAAPAAQADTIIPFTNWQVGGNLGVKKLNQNIPLPAGSTFNGSANLTQGTITGDTTIPNFTTTVKVLGIPTRIGLSIKETAPVSGTLTFNSDGTVTLDAPAASDIRIRTLSLGLLTIPAGFNCHTSSPVVLPLHATAPLATALSSGLTFSGTYDLPKLTGCGLLTPTLNLLMAGPNNPFNVTFRPPAS